MCVRGGEVMKKTPVRSWCFFYVHWMWDSGGLECDNFRGGRGYFVPLGPPLVKYFLLRAVSRSMLLILASVVSQAMTSANSPSRSSWV